MITTHEIQMLLRPVFNPLEPAQRLHKKREKLREIAQAKLLELLTIQPLTVISATVKTGLQEKYCFRVLREMFDAGLIDRRKVRQAGKKTWEFEYFKKD